MKTAAECGEERARRREPALGGDRGHGQIFRKKKLAGMLQPQLRKKLFRRKIQMLNKKFVKSRFRNIKLLRQIPDGNPHRRVALLQIVHDPHHARLLHGKKVRAFPFHDHRIGKNGDGLFRLRLALQQFIKLLRGAAADRIKTAVHAGERNNRRHADQPVVAHAENGEFRGNRNAVPLRDIENFRRVPVVFRQQCNRFRKRAEPLQNPRFIAPDPVLRTQHGTLEPALPERVAETFHTSGVAVNGKVHMALPDKIFRRNPSDFIIVFPDDGAFQRFAFQRDQRDDLNVVPRPAGHLIRRKTRNHSVAAPPFEPLFRMTAQKNQMPAMFPRVGDHAPHQSFKMPAQCQKNRFSFFCDHRCVPCRMAILYNKPLRLSIPKTIYSLSFSVKEIFPSADKQNDRLHQAVRLQSALRRIAVAEVARTQQRSPFTAKRSEGISPASENLYFQ